MQRDESMQRLKFLYDQVHQTTERAEHLDERMPMHVHPQSLNYEKDLTRIKGEYNRLVKEMADGGLITDDELVVEGLPEQV